MKISRQQRKKVATKPVAKLAKENYSFKKITKSIRHFITFTSFMQGQLHLTKSQFELERMEKKEEGRE